MAQTPPTVLEPRVRFWREDTLELLWTSACDVEELLEETRQELGRLVDAGEWIVATVDLVPVDSAPEVRGDWRTRWGGKMRLNPTSGRLEFASARQLLNKMTLPPNPTFGRPDDHAGLSWGSWSGFDGAIAPEAGR